MMVTVPLLLVLALVWLPALLSVVLSFGKWNGFGDLDTIEWVGVQNYQDIVTIYPPFWPAIQHNLIWLVFLFVFPTVLGMLLAVLLDREMRGSRFYQTAFYMPVVLSAGPHRLHLAALLLPRPGPDQRGLRHRGRLVRRPGHQPVGGARRHGVAPHRLHHADLPGRPEGRRRHPARGSRRRRRRARCKTFFHVIFPVMRPINMIVIVIVVIESLRAFDLVWVINKGRNGLEVIGALVAQNVIGEATRYGFGSALAVIMMLISSIFITIYLRNVFREERQR